MTDYHHKTSIVPKNIANQTLITILRFLAKKCRHILYGAKESLGFHKRELVVSRVEDACGSLQETKVQFETALDKFKQFTHYDDSPLEQRYQILKHQFELSQAKANIVRERVLAIEEISEALFNEWQDELQQYSNRTLRAQSRQHLKTSRQHYGRLIKALCRAEAKIQPVLAAFKDQVLFLKHNLNAQAIAALQHELVEISIDISRLIQAMEYSIEEANYFVITLVDQKALPGSK
jgi:hypothetical protein